MISKEAIPHFVGKRDAKKVLRIRAREFKERFEKKEKKVVAVLGSFDTWSYMDFISRLLASKGHAAVTSIRIYFENERGRITFRERYVEFRSVFMRDSLRFMIGEEAHKAIIAYSIPGAHYIETEWCFKRAKRDKTFEVIGIAFVRDVKKTTNNCGMLASAKVLDSTTCNAHQERTAWQCMDEEGFCPFVKQQVAKNVIEYYFQDAKMKLYAVERLDILPTLLERIV